jgi:hypothetical protein
MPTTQTVCKRQNDSPERDSVGQTATLTPSRNTRVCIVQPNKGNVSETFINAHAARLPCHVDVVYGDRPRLDGVPLLSDSVIARTIRQTVRHAAGAGGNFER